MVTPAMYRLALVRSVVREWRPNASTSTSIMRTTRSGLARGMRTMMRSRGCV